MNKAIESLCRYIEANADQRLTLAALGERAGMSPWQCQRAFKTVTGLTPLQYQQACRTRLLKQNLREAPSTTQAIYAAGYGSGSRVYEYSDARLGMTPDQYRRSGEGMQIAYASADTVLGLLMLGATDRGLCFVEFGDTEKQLLADLRREFPRARVAAMKPGNPQFTAWVEALNAYLQGGSLPVLPLDIRGTAFQLRVWQFLQTIPAGECRSYTEVAVSIGKPRAVRAVARACASNCVALLIPCHRVIRGDGGLGGYRWGLQRKRKLLQLERSGSNLSN